MERERGEGSQNKPALDRALINRPNEIDFKPRYNSTLGGRIMKL